MQTKNFYEDVTFWLEPKETEMEDDLSIEQLKVEINNFIHMHGPREMTLGRAEEVALEILSLLHPGWESE